MSSISTKQTITSHLKLLNTKKTMTFSFGIQVPGLRQVQTCGCVKLVKGIKTLPMLITVSFCHFGSISCKKIIVFVFGLILQYHCQNGHFFKFQILYEMTKVDSSSIFIMIEGGGVSCDFSINFIMFLF